MIIHEQLYYVSVGDSYLYLFRGGKLLRINAEHNMCHQRYLENIRDGHLDAIECRNDPEAAVLTSFLGMADELIAALSCGSVHQMCKKIEKAITDHADPNQDNYTAVILKCV